MAIHEMSFTRLLDAPADKLFRCWTTPDLMKQWFAPQPWTVPVAQVDLKPGGANNITMRSPQGQDMPCPGQYLEVVPNRKLVFTDAFTGDWMPKDGAPFMVATVTFERTATRPATPPRCGTGAKPIAPGMSRWAFTPAGTNAPTSSKRWRKRFEEQRP